MQQNILFFLVWNKWTELQIWINVRRSEKPVKTTCIQCCLTVGASVFLSKLWCITLFGYWCLQVAAATAQHDCSDTQTRTCSKQLQSDVCVHIMSGWYSESRYSPLILCWTNACCYSNNLLPEAPHPTAQHGLIIGNNQSRLWPQFRLQCISRSYFTMKATCDLFLM